MFFISLCAFKEKKSQKYNSQKFRNLMRNYILPPQYFSHLPYKLTVSLMLLDAPTWAKLSWDNLPSSARKSPSSRESFFSYPGYPGLPGLTQDFICSLDLQEVPLSLFCLVLVVVRVPDLH